MSTFEGPRRLGTAVGDAIGLPYEGVSAKRALRMLGPPERHRFIFRRGMISDDTEHTCMVAQSLIDANADADRFAQRLASEFRPPRTVVMQMLGTSTEIS